mgnify:FL=1
MKLQSNVMDEGITEALSGAATLATIISLVYMPNGMQRMNPEMPHMVQTSLNLGTLRTKKDNVSLSYSVRSSIESEKNSLIEKMRSLTEIFGGQIVVSGEYPGWAYREDSKLRDTAVEAYRKLYNEEPVIEAIHAGLECGLFAEKVPDFDMVSFGPNL